ncbi:MAG: prephenate dehydratase [SAR202 cluster bacterium]|nr:prephenate dehydratase [SAR202 cluster bacterium]
MRVSLLGPKGTFSEEAALKFFKQKKIVYKEEIHDIFNDVLNGNSKFGVVPIENSLEGPVSITLDLFLKFDLKIYSEIILDIKHNLLGINNSTLKDIKEIISHPQALAQCKKFIKNAGFTTKNCLSTADAAKNIFLAGDNTIAAIGSITTAKIYNLIVLEESIQDENFNQTRFIVLSKKDNIQTGEDKTSVIFMLPDKPGALYDALGAFVKERINLVKIESRPSRKGLGDYIFFVDFLGHRCDQRVKNVLKALKNKVTYMQLLGSYPSLKQD